MKRVNYKLRERDVAIPQTAAIVQRVSVDIVTTKPDTEFPVGTRVVTVDDGTRTRTPMRGEYQSSPQYLLGWEGEVAATPKGCLEGTDHAWVRFDKRGDVVWVPTSQLRVSASVYRRHRPDNSGFEFDCCGDDK